MAADRRLPTNGNRKRTRVTRAFCHLSHVPGRLRPPRCWDLAVGRQDWAVVRRSSAQPRSCWYPPAAVPGSTMTGPSPTPAPRRPGRSGPRPRMHTFGPCHAVTEAGAARTRGLPESVVLEGLWLPAGAGPRPECRRRATRGGHPTARRASGRRCRTLQRVSRRRPIDDCCETRIDVGSYRGHRRWWTVHDRAGQRGRIILREQTSTQQCLVGHHADRVEVVGDRGGRPGDTFRTQIAHGPDDLTGHRDCPITGFGDTEISDLHGITGSRPRMLPG